MTICDYSWIIFNLPVLIQSASEPEWTSCWALQHLLGWQQRWRFPETVPCAPHPDFRTAMRNENRILQKPTVPYNSNITENFPQRRCVKLSVARIVKRRDKKVPKTSETNYNTNKLEILTNTLKDSSQTNGSGIGKDILAIWSNRSTIKTQTAQLQDAASTLDAEQSYATVI